MRKRKFSYKKISKNLKTLSYFPRYVSFNEELINNFESQESKIFRANLILAKKDLPFVYGYLYSFDGNFLNNKIDLELSNEFLLNNFYVLEDNGAYSVDGKFFDNVFLAKKYNDNVAEYYYHDFGWIQEEICEPASNDILVLKRKK